MVRMVRAEAGLGRRSRSAEAGRVLGDDDAPVEARVVDVELAGSSRSPGGRPARGARARRPWRPWRGCRGTASAGRSRRTRILIMPAFSTTNRRPLPSPALVTNSGDLSPLATLDSDRLSADGLTAAGAAPPSAASAGMARSASRDAGWAAGPSARADSPTSVRARANPGIRARAAIGIRRTTRSSFGGGLRPTVPHWRPSRKLARA